MVLTGEMEGRLNALFGVHWRISVLFPDFFGVNGVFF
jgi:hypothetical protein